MVSPTPVPEEDELKGIPEEDELKGMSLQKLQRILHDHFDDSEAAAQDLDRVLEVFFDRYSEFATSDPAAIPSMLELSDHLAIKFGLPTAVANYAAHKSLSDQWKGVNSAELTYSFKNDEGPGGYIHPNLQAHILGDVAGMGGASSLDDVTDKDDDGKIVGVKVKDTTIANNIVGELQSNTPPDLSKFNEMTPEEQKDALSWRKQYAADHIKLTWEAWQKTYDKAQKSILTKNTIEEMGEEMCLQIFLLPFKFLENWTAKLDDWVKKKAKERKSLLGSNPGIDESGTMPPSPPGPKDGPETPGEESTRALQAFRREYIKLVEKEGETDSARKAFAEELKTAWNELGLTAEEFHAKYPDLETRLFKDFDHTLVENYVAACKKKPEEVTDFDRSTEAAVHYFFICDFFNGKDGKFKQEFIKKFKEAGIEIPKEWYAGKRDGDRGPDKKDDNDDKNPPHTPDDKKDDEVKDEDASAYSPESAPARAEARIRALIWGREKVEGVSPSGTPFEEDKNDALRSPYLITAKPVEKDGEKRMNHYGTIVDSKAKTITRYHEEAGKMTSVTYFVENGSAVIRESSIGEGGKVTHSTEKHVTGLATGTPKIGDKEITGKQAEQWTELFARNEISYKVGIATNFTGRAEAGLQLAKKMQEGAEQNFQWDVIQKTR